MIQLSVFIFGLLVGSFLNSVVYSLEEGIPIWRLHSECPRCGQRLKVSDLVPLLSFVLLGGRCRYCGRKISWQYPLVESATGGLFLLSRRMTSHPSLLLFYWVVVSLLLLIFIYDFKHYLIPDRIIYPALVITAGYRLLRILRASPPLPWAGLAAASGAVVFFALLHLLSRGEWLGFGDVKMVLFMGLLLGFPRLLVALCLAALLGASVGALLVFTGRKEWKSKIPFGPFLVAGTLVALFSGSSVVALYLDLFML